MTLVREHLDPKRLLVCETVRWLAGRVREDESGAKSLAHVLVVVPTAQSARSLRLAIAEAWSPAGVLPPKTAMAKDLLSGDDARVATKAEELAAMAQVLLDVDIDSIKALFPKPPAERSADWALDAAAQLLGVMSLLGEQAMTMGEVVCEEDAARWRDLALGEELFFARLKSCGVAPSSIARRAAVEGGNRPWLRAPGRPGGRRGRRG